MTDSYDIETVIQAILFASGEPVDIKRIAAALNENPVEVSMAIDRLTVKMNAPDSGIRLVRLEDSAQLCSAPEYADIIRTVLEERKPPKLSRSALEALAVVAYYQPVTKAVIDQIRGVDSDYTVKILLERGFIEKQGQLAVPGRPTLYGTTKDFLRVFGISRIEELPELPGVVKSPDNQAKIADVLEKIKAVETADSEDTANSEPAADSDITAEEAEKYNSDEG